MNYHQNITELTGQFECIPTNEMKEKFNEGMLLNSRQKNGLDSIANFIVFEYLPITLKDFLQKNQVSLERKIFICNGISKGLSYLYDHHIIHRNINLENIYIDNEDCIKISDFKMAILTNSDKIYMLNKNNKLLGDKETMAPEVYNEYKNQMLNDTNNFILFNYSKQPSWELGIITHKILTNTHPFLNYPIKDLLDFNSQLLLDLNISQDIIEKISLLLKEDMMERGQLTLF